MALQHFQAKMGITIVNIRESKSDERFSLKSNLIAVSQSNKTVAMNNFSENKLP